MPRDRRDFFYRKAKVEGYRSRAAFKLKQINEKFKIIKKGDTVVDLGAAPGGWLQVAKELSGGKVLGVDILPIDEIEGVDIIKGDIRLDTTIEKIKEKSKRPMLLSAMLRPTFQEAGVMTMPVPLTLLPRLLSVQERS